MKAVGYRQSLPIGAPDALLDVELPEPAPGPRDLIVTVRAVSANPVDTGVIRTTLAQEFGTINAANLKRAHALIESGRSRGKIVLAGI